MPTSRDRLIAQLALLLSLLTAPVGLAAASDCGAPRLEESSPLAVLAPQIRAAQSGEDLEALRALAQQVDELTRNSPQDALYSFYSARAHASLLIPYATRGDKKKAKQELETALRFAERALELDEASASAHALRAELYGWKIGLSNAFSRMFSGMKYGPKIGRDLERARELEPENAGVFLSVGHDYFHKLGMVGGSTEEAIKNFRRAVELDPGCVEGWIWLGVALRKEKQTEKAKQALEEALRLDPENVRAKRERDRLGRD